MLFAHLILNIRFSLARGLPISSCDVRKRLGVSRTTVCSFLKRWRQGGGHRARYNGCWQFLGVKLMQAITATSPVEHQLHWDRT